MSKTQKTYRARTNVSQDTVVNVNLNRDIDFLEILSLKLDTSKVYRVQSSDRGVVIGRVLANGGFGIPNAKVSIFVPLAEEDNANNLITQYYAWTTATDMPAVDLQYNILPDYVENQCNRAVGTFPAKRVVLDNNDVLEVFDKYYRYTTATNNAGDYMIYGVPVGQQTLHVDIDLSDIGILSQRPRDMFYKGFTMEQFENANVFKTDTNLKSLAQIHSQNQAMQVYPFWGDKDNGIIGISRCDVNIDYRFEPTCVFMGSTMTDSEKNGISRYCTPSNDMGKVSEMVTTEGTIEMIRKTTDGRVEEFMIQGNRLIDKDGVFCYQIPMNLDYMTTNEFGEMVPSNNPSKGIATRCRVRFRFSLDIMDTDASNRHRAKFLVPNNPHSIREDSTAMISGVERDDSYVFGTYTNENDFVDLFWNKVYSVKSYIPRLQRLMYSNTKYYTGLKATNYPGTNTPAPYNHVKVQISARYVITCILAKIMVFAVAVINLLSCIFSADKEEEDDDENNDGTAFGCIPFIFDEESTVLYLPGCAPRTTLDTSYNDDQTTKKYHSQWNWSCAIFMAANGYATQLGSTVITPSMWQNNYGYDYSQFKSIYVSDPVSKNGGVLLRLDNITPTTYSDGNSEAVNTFSNDDDSLGRSGNRRTAFYRVRNKLVGNLTTMLDRIEQKLADSEEIVNFDFYNDWVNGLLYFPLWKRYYRPQTRILFGIKLPEKERFCECKDKKLIAPALRVFDSCVYPHNSDGTLTYTEGGTASIQNTATGKHKHPIRYSISSAKIKSGIIKKVKQKVNADGDTLNVYYYAVGDKAKDGVHYIPLFTTDIVNIGSFNDCDSDGFPQLFKFLPTTSANIPPMGTTYMTDSEDGPSEGGTTSEVEATGIDYNDHGSYGSSTSTSAMYGNGLFVNLTCTTIYSNAKTCMNAQRISELGVGLDTTYDSYSAHTFGTVKTKYADGLVTQFDIVDPEARAMFASLNNLPNEERTEYDSRKGYIVPRLSPIYFFGFDGMGDTGGWLNTLTSQMSYHDIDPADSEYLKFRYGNTKQQARFYDEARKIPRFENSFFFYFGAKDGATAMDQFKAKYYADCEKKAGDNITDEDEQ